MKTLIAVLIAAGIGLVGSVKAAVVYNTGLSFEQYTYVAFSGDAPAFALLQAGGFSGTGPESKEYSIGHGSTYDQYGDIVWQSGVSVHSVLDYDGGGLLTLTVGDGTPVTLRPTSAFTDLVFGMYTTGLIGVSIVVSDITLTQMGFGVQDLPDASVNRTFRSDGYTLTFDNASMWSLGFVTTYTHSEAIATGDDFVVGFALVPHDDVMSMPGNSAPAPEPTTALLIAFTGAGFLCFGRRWFV